MITVAPFGPRHATRPELGQVRQPAELMRFRLLLELRAIAELLDK